MRSLNNNNNEAKHINPGKIIILLALTKQQYNEMVTLCMTTGKLHVPCIHCFKHAMFRPIAGVMRRGAEKESSIFCNTFISFLINGLVHYHSLVLLITRSLSDFQEADK